MDSSFSVVYFLVSSSHGTFVKDILGGAIVESVYLVMFLWRLTGPYRCLQC